MAVEPSALALFWAGAIAVSIVAYVVLDGFDLGVGILFGFTKDRALQGEMMDSIAPFWDGNETWLIMVGASLFAAFPTVYAVFLPAFYFPVLLLMVALIFRGVAFEFKHQGRAGGLWDKGFFWGSTIAAWVQGAAVGAMIRGIPVANGQFAGGRFDWLDPFPVLTGLGLVLGYALLGAGWIVMKSEGRLRDWTWPHIPRLALCMLVVLAIATVVAILEHNRNAESVMEHRLWGLIFPLIGAAAILGVLLTARRRHDTWPFFLTVIFFAASFATLAVLFWPHMIPYTVTVGNAAAPEASLSFLFWGAGLFALPLISIYTIGIYWFFRGKTRKGYGA
jgi:cytochrome d ubiquinol oxidase subunit II